MKLNIAGPAERLKRFLELQDTEGFSSTGGTGEWEGIWVPVYGVIRRPALVKTQLIGPYVSSDTVLLEELLMQGQFSEIEETLFYKRDHPTRSMRACAAFVDRISWFTGSQRRTIVMPKLRVLIERLKAALLAPISFGEKMNCLKAYIARYATRGHNLKVIKTEVSANIRRILRLKAPTEW